MAPNSRTSSGEPLLDDGAAGNLPTDPLDAQDGPLDVLLLEDVATDAELIQHELRKEGIDFEAQHVTSRDGFRLALDAGPPDIILADYSLPAFDGLDALRMAQEHHPEVPVVFVSGAIGEERAIETLKQGATDYVLKDKLSRLAPAAKRALREAAERQARREAEHALKQANEVLEQTVEARTAELRQANAVLTDEIEERKRVETALRESQERLSALIDSAIDAIVSVDPSLDITLFNNAAEEIFGCETEEAVCRSLDSFLADDLQALVEQYIERHPAEDGATADGRYVGAAEGFNARRFDGTAFPVEATITPVQLPSEPQYLLILRDIQEIKHAEEKLTQLQSEKVYLQEEIENEYNFDEIVGVSPAIQDVFDAIDQVAATDTTVLVSGKTGTGKELVARALHDRSHRADSVLVKVNCAALSSDLIESELFGHEKGAFTGATTQRKGRFELADGGTLFLDEVGELPMDTQAKLLRALQEQEFERVGGSETIEVDTRILAATNRDLGQAVHDGTFRSDLYYRLNIFPIELPPLKERREDIPLLAHHFCDTFAGRTGTTVERISPNAMAVLERYDWPGNVRELANIIERAVILARDGVIRADHLSIERPDADTPGETFPTYEEAQRRHIIRALEHTGGVVGGDDGAAALLDVNRTTLLSRMDRLGIDPDNYR